MSLMCQKNSYQKEFVSKLVSCEKTKEKVLLDGKQVTKEGYSVMLEDTILFPEGGGQPDDRGWLNGVDVLKVSRHGATVNHFTLEPVSGEEIKITVNWQRRWDHMQQHSGQHLVTAIADSRFGFNTTSWNLGETVSSIELDTPAITTEQIQSIEDEVNDLIRQGRKMFPTLYDLDNVPEKIRTRMLPDDHVGQIRVVTIEGVDDNTCCGTHVASLAHLQAIKILGCEKGKKGKVNILFLAGQRVMDFVRISHERNKALNGFLKGSPDQFVSLVDKMQKSLKLAQKTSTTLIRELASLEAGKINESTEKLHYHHRKEGDNDYLSQIVREVKDTSKLLFLTTGEEKGAGMFLLAGDAEIVAEVGPRVAEMLDGKGAGKNGRFQGKVNKLSRSKEVVKFLQDRLEQTN